MTSPPHTHRHNPGSLPGRDPSADSVVVPLPIIPGYTLLGEIGRGGMGTVYKAIQDVVGRAVAIKVIARSGRDPLAVERSRIEAQSIGRIRHPNVVELFDYGEREEFTFLVMEYVGGPTLLQATGGRPQPGRWAAGVLEAVARGIHVAHRIGVIHRDLKPNNILLPDQPTLHAEATPRSGRPPADPPVPSPKVADFGLAKPLSGGPELTRVGLLSGTPGYMAPEQAAWQGVVGPATDVYALGVILYELITGRSPFPTADLPRYFRLLQSAPPPPPRRWNPDVPDDLAAICLKCLETDPGDRYPTAEALADDLGRFVRGEGIAARPLSRGRRVVRTVRRQPLVSGLSAALVFTLAAGCAAATALYLRADADRTAAVAAHSDATLAHEAAERTARELAARRVEADAVNQFLIADILQAAGPKAAGGLGPDATLRQALEQAGKAVSTRFADQPHTAAVIERTIGLAYYNLGDFAPAVTHFRRAKPHLAVVEPCDPADGLTLDSLEAAALVYDGRYDDARKQLDGLVPAWERQAGPASPDALRARWLRAKCRAESLGVPTPETLVITAEVSAACRDALGPDHELTLTAAALNLYKLATSRWSEGCDRELADCLKRAERGFGPAHAVTLELKQVRAWRLLLTRRSAEALEVVREVMGTATEAYGRGHLLTLKAGAQLSAALAATRQHEAAVEVLRDLIRAGDRSLGAGHHQVAALREHLAMHLYELGRKDDALAAVGVARKAVAERYGERYVLIKVLDVRAAAIRGAKPPRPNK